VTGRILVVGDANVDLVLQGDIVPRFGQAEQTLDRADLVLGGSACIMASGIAKLGIATSVVGVVGDDEFGAITRNALVAAGVETSALRVDHTVPTGISVILSAPDDRSILTLPGTVPLLSAAEVRDAVELTDPDHVHFASYFLQPVLARELPGLLTWLRQRGIRSSLDTNWDPDERWSGLGDVLPLLDYLFPNLHELRAIAAALGVSGTSGVVNPDDETLARGLASRGPTVVVKAGADGGWSVTANGAVARAAGPAVDVVDTTGAGDSFDAGYLAAVLSGVGDEQTRLAWAATAGSLSTLGRGGTVAQPTRAELLAGLLAGLLDRP
jgi:sugar/nucleoside kinase (ribokinase family)